MGTQSEQLDQQARHLRAGMSKTMEALRDRMTPGQFVDQVADYAQHGPAAEFFRNLSREVRENPLPLTVVVIGVAWLIIASSLSSRVRMRSLDEAGRESRPRDQAVNTAAEVERSAGIVAAAGQPGDAKRRPPVGLRAMPAMEQAHEG